MKKLVEITPLNRSSKLAYRCEHCGQGGYLEVAPPIDTDYDGDPVDPDALSDIPCQACGQLL